MTSRTTRTRPLGQTRPIARDHLSDRGSIGALSSPRGGQGSQRALGQKKKLSDSSPRRKRKLSMTDAELMEAGFTDRHLLPDLDTLERLSRGEPAGPMVQGSLFGQKAKTEPQTTVERIRQAMAQPKSGERRV